MNAIATPAAIANSRPLIRTLPDTRPHNQNADRVGDDLRIAVGPRKDGDLEERRENRQRHRSGQLREPPRR